MLSIVVLAIYFLAAFALYRLWSTDHSIVWWIVLVSVVLMYWTKETVRTAKNMSIRKSADEYFDGDIRAAAEAKFWLGDGVVRLWVIVNVVITAITLIASLFGLLILNRPA